MTLRIVLCMFLALALFAACKKDEDDLPLEDETISPTTGTRREFTLDSIFLYARQVYLWQDALPSYADFDPRVRYSGISTNLTAFQQELYDISQYKLRTDGTPYEYATNGSKAKYSYMEESAAQSSSSSAATVNGTYAQHLSYWQEGADKVAYLYISSFPTLSYIQSELDAAFADMATEQASCLIVDLRSNGGGYVRTVEYLANLMAPATLEGKTMYSEQFNALMQQGNARILQKQPYYDENGNTVQYNNRTATMADVDFSEKANTYAFNPLCILNNADF